MVRQVQRAIQQRIEIGELKHGTQLPSMRQLSEQTAVSVGVIRQAISQLTNDGYLRVDARRGVYVSKPQVRVRDIALVLPLVRTHFLARLLEGIHQGLAGTDGRLVVESAKAGYDEQMALLDRLDRAFVAGVIITPPPFAQYAQSINELRDRGLPCVQATAVLDQTDAPAVVTDEYEAGRLAIEQLTEAGHTRIGLLDNNTDARSTRDLRQGINAGLAMINEQMSSIPVVEGNAAALDGSHPFEDGERAAMVLLEKYPQITAVVGMTPNRTIGAYRAAVKLGRRVPDDLSIIGVGGDIDLMDMVGPGLTMIDRPTEMVGRRAAALIQQLIDGEAPTSRTIQLQPVLKRRGSVAPPRS